MQKVPPNIDAFLVNMRQQIPLVDAWWQRALAEVEDHLRSSAASWSDDLPMAEAEAKAVERFGTISTILQGLGAEYAYSLVRRYGLWLLALGAAFMMAALTSRNGPLLIGHIGQQPVLSMIILVLVQVGWFTALLTGVRVAFLLGTFRSLTGLPSLVNGAAVMLGSFTAAAALKLLVLIRTQGLSSLDVGLLAMLVLVATSSPMFWNSWRRFYTAAVVLSGNTRDVEDEQALPLLRHIHPAFRVAARHPRVLVVVTCLLAASWSFMVGAMPDGLWPSLVVAWGRLYAGALSGGLDIFAVLACYRLIGSTVGVRAGKRGWGGLRGARK